MEGSILIEADMIFLFQETETLCLCVSVVNTILRSA